jgi:predicted nucleic acid-binding protein
MIVVDASAVLEILKGTKTGANLLTALPGLELHAPHLIDLEVINALRRWEFQAEMSAGDIRAALEVFREMTITRHAHTSLLGEIWSLRHNLTAYDGAYLALARLLGAELVTMDGGLRKLAARKR